jgi:hypothetical protein
VKICRLLPHPGLLLRVFLLLLNYLLYVLLLLLLLCVLLLLLLLLLSRNMLSTNPAVYEICFNPCSLM